MLDCTEVGPGRARSWPPAVLPRARPWRRARHRALPPEYRRLLARGLPRAAAAPAAEIAASSWRRDIPPQLAMQLVAHRDGFTAAAGLPAPVSGHQLGRPRWLGDFAARQELVHHRFQIDHRSAVDRVQSLDLDRQPTDGHQSAGRDADPVRPHLRPLGQDADRRPVGIAPRVPRAGLDRGVIDLVEDEDDLDVREAIEPGDRVRPHPIRVEHDLDRDVPSSSIASLRDQRTTPIGTTSNVTRYRRQPNSASLPLLDQAAPLAFGLPAWATDRRCDPELQYRRVRFALPEI